MSDVDGTSFTDESANLLFDVSAAPNLDGIWGSWDVPGVDVTASSDLGAQRDRGAMLDHIADTYLGRASTAA